MKYRQSSDSGTVKRMRVRDWKAIDIGTGAGTHQKPKTAAKVSATCLAKSRGGREVRTAIPLPSQGRFS